MYRVTSVKRILNIRNKHSMFDIRRGCSDSCAFSTGQSDSVQRPLGVTRVDSQNASDLEVARKIFIVARIVDYGDTDLNVVRLHRFRLLKLLNLFDVVLRPRLIGCRCWTGSRALQLAPQLRNHRVWIIGF
jgi:hypothetical protein